MDKLAAGLGLLLLLSCTSDLGPPEPAPVPHPAPRDARATGPADASAWIDLGPAPAVDVSPMHDVSGDVDAGPIADGSREFGAGPLDVGVDLADDQAPAAGSYNPCPPRGRPCVALPLGDSLTQGAGSSGGGYRRELFRQVVAQGQALTFVGSARSGPAMLPGVPVPFPRDHEGHGGFTIQMIAGLIRQNDTIATLKPDLVLLEIGTNNGLRRPGADVPAALAALGSLMDQILAADSRLLLIVAQITPDRTDAGVTQTLAFNRGIPALVAARAAAGKHVAIVDIHKFFTTNPNWKTAYLPDSTVHPNDAGYDAMGRGWYSALGPLLR